MTVPGHMQRGGEPCPFDRVISTRLGAAAAQMIKNEEYGYKIAGKLKTVDPNSDIIKEAKSVGISFGDE